MRILLGVCRVTTVELRPQLMHLLLCSTHMKHIRRKQHKEATQPYVHAKEKSLSCFHLPQAHNSKAQGQHSDTARSNINLLLKLRRVDVAHLGHKGMTPVLQRAVRPQL